MTLLTKPLVREKPPRLCYRSMEFRATEPATDGRTLTGYAAVFNEPTMIETFFGDFEEEIAPGAFKRTLKARTPVLQFDHGRDSRTGSLPIGSFSDLREDDRGLFVSARLFDNPVVEPIRQAIEAGAINGMSFRFRIMREEWRDANGDLVKDDEIIDLLWDEDSERTPLRRTIKEVELFELGPVTFPAYESTSVSVRSMLARLDADEQAALIEELNRLLKDSRETAADHQAAVPSEPAEPSGTSGTASQADPVRNHSANLREPATWYLPGPSEVL